MISAELIGKALKPYQIRFDQVLTRYTESLPELKRLKDACCYALQGGGKRFRPALVYMVAEALGKAPLPDAPALAIECFHTASLIADDLPCMDDDAERRGRPSLHIAYDEATALLSSYALISCGYELLSQGDPAVSTLAIQNAAQNTGIQGASGGQILDLYPETMDEAAYREVARLKTVSLFEASFVFGWLFGGGAIDRLPLVKQAAAHFGYAFQMADDLGDVEQDRLSGCLTNIALIVGEGLAKKLVEKEIKGYQTALSQLGINSPALTSCVP